MSTPVSDDIAVLRLLAEIIPALNSGVKCPCFDCNLDMPSRFVWQVILHLNDTIKWPREDIAAWLDSLHLDLRISPTSRGD